MRLFPAQVEWLRAVPGGRKNVVICQVVAGGVFLQRLLLADESLYGALWQAAALDLLLLVLGGVIERYWGGGKLSEASGPGGAGLKFEQKTSRFGVATRRSLQLLEERLDQQMLSLSERLLAVEKAAAGAKQPLAEEEERGDHVGE